MSLLAELLSKVKNQGIKRDVPPNLKQVVEHSTEKAALRKKIIILSVLVLVAVVAGFGAVYYMETFLKPDAVTRPLRRSRPDTPVQAVNPPVQPSPTSSVSTQASEQAHPTPKKAARKREKKVLALYGKNREETKPSLPPSEEGISKKDGSQEIKVPLQRNLTTEERESRDMHLYAAKNYESAKDYKQALSNYQEALRLEPGDYVIMNNISGIMLLMGRNNEALLFAKNALAKNRDYIPALINVGIASIKLNNAEDGKKYLTRALALDPSNKNSLLNLAILNEQNGDYEKAYSSFYKLAQSGDIQGYLGLARVEEKKGNSANAERIYREILSMNGLDPRSRKLASERLSQIESKSTNSQIEPKPTDSQIKPKPTD
ncbi:MAG: tetratricopeptide repeat protein [Nitrospirae bacterium]|nr:tetratricopeptide repeat protein [Nitrospirota bacterium]